MRLIGISEQLIKSLKTIDINSLFSYRLEIDRFNYSYFKKLYKTLKVNLAIK